MAYSTGWCIIGCQLLFTVYFQWNRYASELWPLWSGMCLHQYMVYSTCIWNKYMVRYFINSLIILSYLKVWLSLNGCRIVTAILCEGSQQQKLAKSLTAENKIHCSIVIAEGCKSGLLRSRNYYVHISLIFEVSHIKLSKLSSISFPYPWLVSRIQNSHFLLLLCYARIHYTIQEEQLNPV